jgi:methionyl-tRNA formyltransferase
VRQHTISLCYAADKVDSGNILAKARVPICGNYVASMLRQAGQIAISAMIKRYTARFSGEKPKGLPQPPGGSYNPRRTADDARINVCAIFNDVIPHLLGSEPPNLAYFDHRGHRFRVHVVPDDMEFCRDFTIEEYFSGSESPDAVVKLSLTE